MFSFRKKPENNEQPELGQDTKVTVHLPDEIGIELVQANELRHYELFNWLLAPTTSIAVGFWTAYILSEKNPVSLLGSAIAFTAISALFFILALRYRNKVYHKSARKSLFLGDFRPSKTKTGK